MPDNDDPEAQPLNGGAPKNNKEDKNKPGPNDYVEKRKYCWCFSIKCEVIFCGFVIFAFFMIDYVLQEAIQSVNNKYIDSYFCWVVLVVLLPFFVGFVLFLIYVCAPDSPDTRKLTPIYFLLSGISAVLVLVWLVSYYAFIY